MKYIDKSFWKFSFGFLCIICAVLLLFYFVSSHFGDNQIRNDAQNQTASSR